MSALAVTNAYWDNFVTDTVQPISPATGIYVPGLSTLGTTTASSINGFIFLGTTQYPFTLAGAQKALNSMPASGGVVILPCNATSTSWTSYALITKSNTTVQGCGGSSIVYLENGSNSDVFRVGDAVNPYHNVNFYNFAIDGNKANNSGACSGAGCTRNLIRYRSDNLTSYGGNIRGVYAHNGIQNGFSIESHKKVSITDSRSENNGNFGVWGESLDELTLGPGLFTQGNTICGVKIYGSSRVAFEGYESYRDAECGIALELTQYTGLGTVVIQQAGYPSGTGAAIQLKQSQAVTLGGGVTIADSYGSAISLTSSDNNSFTGVNIHNSSQLANNTYSDVVLTENGNGYSDNNSFVGRNITSNASNKSKYHFEQVQAGHTGNQFSSNNVSGAVTGLTNITGSTNTFLQPIGDLTYISSKVGIGIASSTGSTNKLSILGADDTVPALGYPGGKVSICNGNTTTAGYCMLFGVLGTGGGFIQQQRIDSSATAYSLSLQPNGGAVSIGIATTTSPNSKLTLYGADDTIPSLGFAGGKFGMYNGTGVNALYGLLMGVLGTGDVYQQAQRIDGGTGVYNILMQPNGGSVSIGATSLSSASALLDVQSTSKGFLAPRMTTTQRDAISSPAEGLIIYNLTTHKLNVRTVSAWEAVTSL